MVSAGCFPLNASQSSVFSYSRTSLSADSTPKSYVPSAYHLDGANLYSKSRVQSVFDPRVSTMSYRPTVDQREMNDTDFEEDLSELDEYEGRRSEDSYGKRSATTLSSFDELRTPDMQSNGFEGFNFQLEEEAPVPAAAKSVQGPSGPHLFRLAQDSSTEVDFYLSMSPPQSPEDVRAGPTLNAAALAPTPAAPTHAPPPVDLPPRTSVPLRTWTPRQVAEWMYSTGFDRNIVDTFFINDISGVTLIDLQYDDLKELGIASFGQRHRLWTEIRALKENKLPSPDEELVFSPVDAPPMEMPPGASKHCSTPPSPEEEVTSPTSGRRRRRQQRGDDIISPAESASIVAIEQLLPKPHKCSKGENCSKWQKQQRKLAKIATEFPMEMAQIANAKNSNSPVESGVGSTSIVVPSVVASSDLLGPTRPSIRLEEGNLRVVQSRDPQENVRRFLDFQHVNESKAEDASTPPFEMFPPLSPPKGQPPHTNLRTLPKLTIPRAPDLDTNTLSANRTARPHGNGAPLTALDANQRAMAHDIWRLGSPASEMDVPVTAIPIGPIERDVSSSVPPDMRFGEHNGIPRSVSRTDHRGPPPASFYNFAPPPTVGQQQIRRSASSASGRNHRRRPSSNVPSVHTLAEEQESNDGATTVIDDDYDANTSAPQAQPQAPPSAAALAGYNHVGWMKKRKTKLLRHEWQDAHFRLRGTQLAMHDTASLSKSARPGSLDDSALEYIDVDDYAVAICASHSKLNSAFKRLHLNTKKKEGDGAAAFAFQLTPAARPVAAGVGEEGSGAGKKESMMHAATGKTHHFAVKTATERIDWMRELMLARARKQKDVGITSFE